MHRSAWTSASLTRVQACLMQHEQQKNCSVKGRISITQMPAHVLNAYMARWSRLNLTLYRHSQPDFTDSGEHCCIAASSCISQETGEASHAHRRGLYLLRTNTSFLFCRDACLHSLATGSQDIVEKTMPGSLVPGVGHDASDGCSLGHIHHQHLPYKAFCP